MIGAEHAGFDSPRLRANSGNSSNSGCSPATLGTPLESDINPCFTLPPATWDVLYPPKQETLSESLADIFISDAAAGSGSASPSAQMYGSHRGLQQPAAQPPMFMTSEAYAHGVPVHHPSPQRFVPQSYSPTVGCGVVNPSGYPPPGTAYHQTNGGGGGQAFGCNGSGGPTPERVPTLGELLQDQQQPSRSGYMLNTFLTSGGSVTSPQQQQQQGWSGAEHGTSGPPVPPGGGTPLHRPLHVNQRLLMQLLATKPHLARRLQQLLEAKRRQLAAMQQAAAAPSSMSASQSPLVVSPPTSVPSNTATMLQQLLTAGGPKPHPPGGATHLDSGADKFPKDLDLDLLDLQSTADIRCDIEQVINHELSFGDKLDFSFDQLHLDEFDVDFDI